MNADIRLLLQQVAIVIGTAIIITMYLLLVPPYPRDELIELKKENLRLKIELMKLEIKQTEDNQWEHQ